MWDTLKGSLDLGDIRREWDDAEACKNLKHLVRSLANREPKLPPGVRHWYSGKWRVLTQKTLASSGAQWWFDPVDDTSRILWPVWDHDQDLIGWVARTLEDKGQKYRNMPRMNALYSLWPNPSGQSSSVVLVEGIVDCLRLLQAGIPAVANIGTAWSKARTELLASVEARTYVVAMDSDEAGRASAFKLGKTLERAFGTNLVKYWYWPDGCDAGDTPFHSIRSLRTELGLEAGPHLWLEHIPKVEVLTHVRQKQPDASFGAC